MIGIASTARRARGLFLAGACACALAPGATATLPPPGIGPGAAGWTTFLEPSAAVDLAVTGSEVWVATATGLRAYDTPTGAWASYFHANGLPADAISAVAADGQGRVWIGTSASDLARVERDGTITSIPGALLGINALGGVNTLAPVGDSLWVGAANGIALLRVSRLSTVGLGSVPSAVRRTVRDVLVDGADTYVASDSTVARFGDGAWTDLRANLPHVPVLSLALALGAVYAATSEGVYRRADTDTAWTKELGNAAALGSVKKIAGSGTLLVAATSTGVWSLDAAGADWTSQAFPAGVTANAIGLIGGDAWVGTNDGVAGATLGTSPVWTTAVAPGTRSLSVRDVGGRRIAFETDGTVWITTQRGGAARYDGATWSMIGAAQGLGNDEFWFAAFVDRDGGRWFGNWGEGVAHVTGAWPGVSYEFLPPGAGLSSSFVMGINQDAAGRLWFGHDNNPLTGETYGLDVRDTGGAWSTIAEGDVRYALTSNRVWSVTFDLSGRAWLGEKSGGVDVWNTRNFTSTSPLDWYNIGTSQGLPSSDVYAVAINEPDAWIASTGGLVRVNTTTLAVTDVYTAADGLPSGDVRSVVVDDALRVWAGTAEGLAMLRGDGTFEVYTTSNSGIVSNRVYDVRWNSAKSELWIATADGVSRYVPQTTTPPTPGTVTITAGPNPLPRGSGASLALGGFTGAVTASVYGIDGRLVRRVTGVEAGEGFWNGTDESGAALPPGIYVVHVQNAGFEARVTVAIAP